MVFCGMFGLYLRRLLDRVVVICIRIWMNFFVFVLVLILLFGKMRVDGIKWMWGFELLLICFLIVVWYFGIFCLGFGILLDRKIWNIIFGFGLMVFIGIICC